MTKKFADEKEKKFYRVWGDMKYRCNNPNCKKYRLYGAKGIKVVKHWESYENFKADMYESYLEHYDKYGKDQTSLDRINPKGNYSPNNCRWATNQEQRLNTHNKAEYDIIDAKTGEIVAHTNNLTRFCKENGFTRSGANAVLKGDRATHNGHIFKRTTRREHKGNKPTGRIK